MRVAPLPDRNARPRRGLALAGAALALMLGLSSIAQPAAANDGAPDAYRAPAWGWQRSYPPLAVYPPPPPPGYHPAPAYPYAPPPPAYRRPTASCDSGNLVAGALVGAGIGGIIASQLGREHDNGGATVFGLLAGAVVGGALGQAADRANGCY